MKEYYYLDDEEQRGPFSINDLKFKELTSETFVWSEEMDNWKKLKELPELQKLIKARKMPPPPPQKQPQTKTEITGYVQVSKKKEPNDVINALKPSRKSLVIMLVWTSFHLFALLMSYTEIEIFNDSGKPRTDKFWPFVDIIKTYKVDAGLDFAKWNGSSFGHKYKTKADFNGLFVEYDWSEFIFYVGTALIVFVIGRVSYTKNETSVANKVPIS